MKVAAHQQQELKKYLNEGLRYRETYAEFYDHILTALEAKPDSASLDEAVRNIIDEDFGGPNGMAKIERQYEIEANKEVRNRYFFYVVDQFKLPLIALTAVLALGFYCLVIQPWFNFWHFALILLCMRIAPSLLRFMRNASAGYIITRPKRSIKDAIFKWLDYLPVFVLAAFIIIPAFYNQTPPDTFTHANAFILCFLLMMLAMHVIAYFRVYKNELQVKISK